jgi:hypothetical protein
MEKTLQVQFVFMEWQREEAALAIPIHSQPEHVSGFFGDCSFTISRLRNCSYLFRLDEIWLYTLTLGGQ